jgi:hypothetical protein
MIELTSNERKKVLGMALSGLSFEEASLKVLSLRAKAPENKELMNQCNGKGCEQPLERALRGLSSFEERILRSTADSFLGAEFSSFSKNERVAMLSLYESIRKALWSMRLSSQELKERESPRKRDKILTKIGSSRNRDNGGWIRR